MDDADSMNCVERETHLGKAVKGEADREFLSDRFCQLTTYERLQRHEPTVRSLPYFIDANDIALLERGHLPVLFKISINETRRHVAQPNSLYDFLAIGRQVHRDVRCYDSSGADPARDPTLRKIGQCFVFGRLLCAEHDRPVGGQGIGISCEPCQHRVCEHRLAHLCHERQLPWLRSAGVETEHLGDRQGDAVIGIGEARSPSHLETRTGRERGCLRNRDAPAQPLRSSVQAVR